MSINEQFNATTRQFAETAAQVNQLALENFEKIFGLGLSTLEQNASATFAYLGELTAVRDPEGLKTLWPKGVQVARENVERAIGASQETLARTLKTHEAIGQIAKGQFESATAQATAAAERTVKQAARAGKA
ncbi:phasin family protein [Luteimonas huabeiensis]|uniref:phasin family protein n=1 Tax=Luteimonas huabeiensis TaxID=1244513 RepID=UPI0004AF238D|nr:phasin family protein [Luteimonas huabeiensis]